MHLHTKLHIYVYIHIQIHRYREREGEKCGSTLVMVRAKYSVLGYLDAWGLDASSMKLGALHTLRTCNSMMLDYFI